MTSRGYFQSVLSNSLAIRQEIQRFESVHPSIYAIYDLIDLIPDGSVAQQIRDHVVCIEDSFVNSQEWTLSRSVPDLRLGIVGSLSSGKSALVHRYLTGSYMQEESPEGGRFKKEIVIDNQNYLLLIRDEGGPPESQFTAWVDAVIFVFSLENESSFNAIYNYYTKMAHYKNSTDIPFILVGTQDAISENNPRVIDDSRAKKLANDLRRCPYYETCATYGLNVERVFQDACQKIMQQRLSLSASCLTPKNSRPSTPNNTFHLPAAEKHFVTTPQSTDVISNSAMNNLSPSHNYSNHKDFMNAHNVLAHRQTYTISPVQHIHRQTDKDVTLKSCMEKWNSSSSTLGSYSSTKGLEPQISIQQENNNTSKIVTTPHLDNAQNLKSSPKEAKDFLTPSSTPTTSRKNRRKSNLFTASKKVDDKLRNCGDFGSGRAIPLKQGYLYKKSSKPLNKEWKKKYVTLCDNGRLTYHPSLHDYMDDVHGKEISLQYVTVKVPGQKPRGSKSITTVTGTNGANNIIDGFNGISVHGKDRCATEKVLLSALETVKDPNWKSSQASGDESIGLSNSNSFLNGGTAKTESSNVKKRHRRMKSSGVKNSEYDDSDDYEFYIVSLDNKQWHFEASSLEERDEWVSVIEQQILNSLQLSELFQVKKQPTETSTLQSIRTRIPGNGVCVDCDAANPDWASLNLGVLMCIECSGIHRNLGSHISKVRSLDLDKWPPGHLSVMLAVGNNVANSVWEYNTQGRTKPTPESSHEEKEQWIRWKYESKDFLPPPNNTMPLGQQLVDVVCSANIKSIIHVLAQVGLEHVNSTVSPRDLRTPLHLSCAMGNLAVAQLLIWHNADVNSVDQDGRTPLAYARAALSIALTKSQVSGGFSSDANVTSCRNLIELLTSHGCTEVTTSNSNTATLLRRRGSQSMTQMEKLPSSII